MHPNEEERTDFLEEEIAARENEEPTELALLGEAIEAARKAFEDLLAHKYNIDPAYYRLSVEIEFRDSSFTENLGKLTYKDLA